MAQKDKEKWNKKYQETISLTKDRDPSRKLVFALKESKVGNALDVACGTGRNSIYLASKGFNVDAIDISEVAIEILKNKGIKDIDTKIVDLDTYTPKENHYDLIIMSNFLDRDLIPSLKNSLKIDGILVIETYMHHKINMKESSNPNFLLKENELKTFFEKDFELIEYAEFSNDQYELYKMMKQSIIVRKKLEKN